MMLNFSDAQLLDAHQWQGRVILLFAAHDGHPQLHKQLTILTAEPEEVTDRGLLIYEIFPGGGRKPGGKSLSAEEARRFYSRYEVEPGSGFTFILVGKDGKEKLRRNEAVSREELFRLIDSMPMRKAEMRRRKENSGQKK